MPEKIQPCSKIGAFEIITSLLAGNRQGHKYRHLSHLCNLKDKIYFFFITFFSWFLLMILSYFYRTQYVKQMQKLIPIEIMKMKLHS